MSEVSFVGSTKSQIWDAYKALLKSNNAQSITTTTEVVANREKATTIASANSIVSTLVHKTNDKLVKGSLSLIYKFKILGGKRNHSALFS